MASVAPSALHLRPRAQRQNGIPQEMKEHLDNIASEWHHIRDMKLDAKAWSFRQAMTFDSKFPVTPSEKESAEASNPEEARAWALLSRGEVRVFLSPHACYVNLIVSLSIGTSKITTAQALWPGLPMRRREQRSNSVLANPALARRRTISPSSSTNPSPSIRLLSLSATSSSPITPSL
jgi:hypothetical protein